MWHKVWHKLTTTLTGGAIIIASASIVSKILGLLRDRLLAGHFGAGDELDIYYAAFRIPDIVFNVLVLGALSAAFVPVFVEYIQKAKEDPTRKQEIWELANSLLHVLLIGLLVIGALFFIFAPYLIPLIAPGFTPEKQQTTVAMTRVMLTAILFFGISNIVTGILNSFKRYVYFAFAPVAYNMGIIFGIAALVPLYGVFGLAYGVVIGAFLHLIIQIPGLLKTGYAYKLKCNIHHPGVRTIGKLMLPRTFGLAVNQIDQLVSVIIGSTLAAGSVAVFNLANNLQSFPTSVFGISIAIASFPFFSESFAQRDKTMFVGHFSKSFRRILFLIIPVSVLLLLLRAQVVRIVLGTGAFDWNDTYYTAQILGFFAISLFAQSLIPLLARSFYAWQDTKTPVKIAILAVVVNIGGALLFTRLYGVIGLGLAFSIASCIHMLILLVALRLRMGYLDDKRIIVSVMKIVCISAVMGGFVVATEYFLAAGVNMQTFIGILIQGVGAAAIGIIVYLILALVTKCDEITILYNWLTKVKKQIFNHHNGQPDGK